MTRRLVLMFVLMAATADAEPTRQRKTSYRRQLITVDVAGIAAFTGGALLAGKPDLPGLVGGSLVAAGITTYVVGGPLVHGVNGNPILRSLGVRLAPVAVGLAVAAVADNCDGGHECAFDGVAEGVASLLITVPAALLIDWFVFSRR